jgi:predicted nucleic acid-binding protein
MFRATPHHDTWMSTLTVAEVLVHPMQADLAHTFEDSIAGLGIPVADVTAGDARLRAGIRATTALNMSDAIVLHLALSEGATVATTHRTLAREARKRELAVLEPT